MNEEGDEMLPWWLAVIAYIVGMIVGNVLTRAVKINDLKETKGKCYEGNNLPVLREEND